MRPFSIHVNIAYKRTIFSFTQPRQVLNILLPVFAGSAKTRRIPYSYINITRRTHVFENLGIGKYVFKAIVKSWNYFFPPWEPLNFLSNTAQNRLWPAFYGRSCFRQIFHFRNNGTIELTYNAGFITLSSCSTLNFVCSVIKWIACNNAPTQKVHVTRAGHC